MAHKAYSGPIRLLPEVEHVWSWFPALAMTCKAPVHREQEAAQTLLVPMASNGLGEKPESAAFLSKDALGLSLVSRGELHFRECSSKKLVLCLFLRCALAGSLPSWRKLGWWGTCTQGLFRPHPPSP